MCTEADYLMDPTELCDGCGEMRVHCSCDDLYPVPDGQDSDDYP